MVRIILAEIIKLWGTKILWLIAVGSLFPLTLNTLGALSKDLSWDNYYFFIWNTTNFLLGPLFFALFIGYVFAREHLEKTINSLFIYPYKKYQFLIGKTIVGFIMISLTSVLTLIGAIFLGLLVVNEPLNANLVYGMVKSTFLSIILQFLLITPAMFVTIIGRSYIPAIVIGIFAVVTNLMIMGTDYNIYFPYSAILLINIHFSPEVFLMETGLSNVHIPLISIIATSLLFFILSLVFYSKRDVHSG